MKSRRKCPVHDLNTIIALGDTAKRGITTREITTEEIATGETAIRDITTG